MYLILSSQDEINHRVARHRLPRRKTLSCYSGVRFAWAPVQQSVAGVVSADHHARAIAMA
jgi:hypothetical protein